MPLYIDFYVLLLLILCILITAIALSKSNLIESKTTTRTTSIDGLRGILALSVFAHHFYISFFWHKSGQWEAPKSTFINNLGSISVSLFFLITGYLFINKLQSSNINWKQLYLSRLKRIYPLYLFVLFFIICITVSQIGMQHIELHEFIAWLYHWLMFTGSSFAAFKSGLIIAGVAWTLIYEWKFYLCLPILYLIYHRKIPLLFSASIIIMFAVYAFHKQSHNLYLLFILAIPAIKYQTKIKKIMVDYQKTVHMFILILSLTCFFFTQAYSIAQMILLSILFAFIANGYAFFSILNNKGLRALGEISYSIYLIHGLILYFLFSIFNIFDFRNHSLFDYYLYFPAVFILVVLISFLTYKYIESPFLSQTQKNT